MLVILVSPNPCQDIFSRDPPITFLRVKENSKINIFSMIIQKRNRAERLPGPDLTPRNQELSNKLLVYIPPARPRHPRTCCVFHGDFG